MTANINIQELNNKTHESNKNDKIQKLLASKWKLKSIYEAGITSDEANFEDVDLVFSPFHIYAMYGNRVEQYKYKFVTDNIFQVQIDALSVQCIIKELNEKTFVFHAQVKEHYFILDMEKEL